MAKPALHPTAPRRPGSPRPARRLLACLACSLWAGLIGTGAARAELTFVWEDAFSEAEQALLTAWLDETHAAVERLAGPFPMDIRAHLHRRDDAGEPVPWANTQRRPGQAVHFHVDPGYSLDAFRADWTAPHELSHLILPYLGRRHAWFAEGFASYLQYQVMQRMGVLSGEQAERRYRRNLERAARRYRYPDDNFVDAAPKLRADRQYPVMYWGGAAYFMRVDRALEQAGSGLVPVLRAYLRCCRRNRDSLSSLLTDLDRLAPEPLFSRHYARLASEPGFPHPEP